MYCYVHVLLYSMMEALHLEWAQILKCECFHCCHNTLCTVWCGSIRKRKQSSFFSLLLLPKASLISFNCSLLQIFLSWLRWGELNLLLWGIWPLPPNRRNGLPPHKGMTRWNMVSSVMVECPSAFQEMQRWCCEMGTIVLPPTSAVWKNSGGVRM